MKKTLLTMALLQVFALGAVAADFPASQPSAQVTIRAESVQVQDSAINTNGTQLLFTTHDALLLDLNFLRRDQIWFAEKNENSCATELYPLSSFSPRKGENIRKGYLQGRFGAIPFIGGEETWQG